MNISVDATQAINLMIEAEVLIARVKELEQENASLKGNSGLTCLQLEEQLANARHDIEVEKAYSQSLRERNQNLRLDLEASTRKEIELSKALTLTKKELSNRDYKKSDWGFDRR